jgi:peptidyl-prolyl cis-trans isomerase A (cyclophilin A)
MATFAAFGSAARADDPQVVLHTSLGDIILELDPTHAPISTANFLRYVDAKKYDGTIFHRIMAGFMAQGGGFKPDMTEIEYFPPIHNEADNGLHNVAGTISMARTNDPESATGQFFLNFVNNSAILDKSDTNAGYAVFGRIVDGMDVLDKMAQVETTMSPMGEKSVPVQQVLLITARRK